MAKKKKARVRKGRPLNVWIDPRLREALDAARKLSRRDITREVEVALERYLEAVGVWPPKETASNADRE